MLCLSACSGGGEEEPTPTPTPTPTPSAPTITIDSGILTNGLSFSETKGEKSVTFTTDADWTLSVAETRAVDWCTPSVTSGTKGTATVKFTVTENTGYDNRKVAVTIKAGSTSKIFNISQKQKDALLVTTDKYEVPQEGGTINVEVKANIDYQIVIAEKAKSWISESTTRVLSTKTHTFAIAASEELEKREGEIYVKSGDKQETIKVYQTGGVVILLSQNEFLVNETGDTITVEIKSNIDYAVQMPELNWLSEVTNTRAASSHTLKYIVAPNEEYDNRSAQIIYYDKNSFLADTLTIIQMQKDAILASDSDILVSPEGGDIEVLVNANIEFETEILNPKWISEATSARGLVEYKRYFTIAKSDSNENRIGKIVFKNTESNVSDTLTIVQAQNDVIALVDDEYIVSSEGEKIEISLNTNIDFTIEMPDVNWLSQATTRAVEKHTLYIDVTRNDSYDNRSAKIIFKDKNSDLADTLTIIQLQKDAIIASKTEYDVASEGDTIELVLQSNVEFNISIDSDWVTQVENALTRGLTSYKLYFKVNENTTEERRMAKITITDFNSGISQSVSINQAQKNVGPAASVKLNGETFNAKLKEAAEDLIYVEKIVFKANSAFESGATEISENMGINFADGVATVHFYAEKIDLTTGKNMFKDCMALTKIEGLKHLDMSKTEDMSYMFYDCKSLSSLDVSGFDTSNVTDMSYMFNNCSSLTSLNLSNFDTSNVTDMTNMFYNCSSLTSLDVLGFKTNKVTNMHSLFSRCSSLTSLDVSKFDTSKVTDMSTMFSSCSSLNLLNLLNFNTSNVNDLSGMFSSCSSLASLDVSSFDTRNVTDMSYMFSGCSSLNSLNLSNFNTSNVTNMCYMFFHCISLTSLNLSNFDTSNVTNMNTMFRCCSSLTTIDLSNFNTNNVTNMEHMFRECTSLASIDLSNFNLLKVSTMGYMFYKCSKLSHIKMMGNPVSLFYEFLMFDNIAANGEFHYNKAYEGNYQKIISQLPSTWTAIPCTVEE